MVRMMCFLIMSCRKEACSLIMVMAATVVVVKLVAGTCVGCKFTGPALEHGLDNIPCMF